MLLIGEVGLSQRLPHQRRAGGDQDGGEMTREPVQGGELGLRDAVRRVGRRRRPSRQQAPPHERHEGDAHEREYQAGWRVAEEAEHLDPVLPQLVVDHDVGRGTDEGEHPAEQRGEGQRDEQPTGRDPEPARHAHHDRHQDRDRAGGAHEARGDGARPHDHDEKTSLGRAADAGELLAEPHRDSRVLQTRADHEEARDHQDDGIGEAGERFARGEHTAEHERGQRHEAHQIERQAVAHEEHHRDAEGDENDDAGIEHGRRRRNAAPIPRSARGCAQTLVSPRCLPS